ncbi:MAG: lysophospholipid acyltransferase family protein [Acutalibacteraceae bacterium]|nr:lysophospholipid acyltransferase family protein [Acutalibacteraceae bacterium]
MNTDVNYKNKKRYNTAKYPIRQPIVIVWLIWILSKIMLMGKKYKIEKINMEGLKPPYMLLSNHMYFIDFELAAMGTFPHRVNNVVSIDGYYRRPWLMELIGAICTRKFTMDLHLIKSIGRVLKRGDILSMYPEARYSPCGTLSYIPDSLGKLIKLNKVPVVAVVHHGNYLHSPFWNFRKKRKVPFYTTFTQILTAEQIKQMSPDEITSAVKKALEYDDYRYQKEKGILITEDFRAEGLHKILYQCPHCMAESQMASKGTEIYCKECGKRWNMNEDGTLSAINGETEFSHIPDWFEWERKQVKQQILDGKYNFEDEVEVYSLPRCWRFIKLGKATLSHDAVNGFTLNGTYRGKEYKISRTPLQTNSLHIEYDYCYLKPLDCVDISTENDSFYCYPKAQNVVTKLAFATEEIYKLNLKEKAVK